MQSFQLVFYQLYQILNNRVSFGSFSFTLYELALAFFGLEIIGYVVYRLFDDDD